MAMPACARETSCSFSLAFETCISTSCSRRASSMADFAFLLLSSSRMYLAARSKSSALQSDTLAFGAAISRQALRTTCVQGPGNVLARAGLRRKELFFFFYAAAAAPPPPLPMPESLPDCPRQCPPARQPGRQAARARQPAGRRGGRARGPGRSWERGEPPEPRAPGVGRGTLPPARPSTTSSTAGRTASRWQAGGALGRSAGDPSPWAVTAAAPALHCHASRWPLYNRQKA